MAFSYSDENFTVVGNLCFVHFRTMTAGNKKVVIPPALGERMLTDEFFVQGYSVISDGSKSSDISVYVSKQFISYNALYENTYVCFFFPIDSNK